MTLRSQRDPRQRTLFNDGWKFRRGDAPNTKASLNYATLRPWLLATGAELMIGNRPQQRPPGNPGGKLKFVQPGFDDADWRDVDLPHDFGIEGPFHQELPGETGKLPWQGAAWYRKRFSLKAADKNRRVFLEVDGAMAFSAFWLNGQFVGGWPYGYTSFQLDLTPYLNFGADNLLAVRLDNPPDSSRWYPGSGLYRNIWLLKTEPVRIAQWGVFVSTPYVSVGRAVINVDVNVENRSQREAELWLKTDIYLADSLGNPKGDILSSVRSTERDALALKLAAGQKALRTLCVTLKKPRLWNLKSRQRYVAVTSLMEAERASDRIETRFGIRTVLVDADRGFLLNGERITLQGVCLHHDQGALGTAVHERALERQLEILQAMGCNAIRTSHNPPTPELLELTDRMGILVMDEAFDCWRRGKKHHPNLEQHDASTEYFDYARVFDDWHERDLRAMLRRDRNHPSVVMWSIGNEVLEQWVSDGWPLATHLAGIVRQEDRTRPVTSAFNGEQAAYSGFQTSLDIVGFNYKPWAYAPLHADNPTLPLLGAETASCISTRGEYFFPVSDDKLQGRQNFQVSSYDLCATEWATPPDQEFEAQDRCPFVAGEFVWTGFDYLGEPTPYNADATNILNFTTAEERAKAAAELEALGRIRVPSRSSYFGIVDLAGFPKDRYYLYQARWRADFKMAHILPHWTWPERVGQVTPVHVYSSADEAELFVNGKSQGRRKKKQYQYRFRWDKVRYEPGELKVVTFKAGKRWATARQRTAGPAAGLTLSPDRDQLVADGRDLTFVTVRIVDADGELVPRASHQLSFSVSGPADIVALDNGDPTSFEPFQGNTRRGFNGLALVVLRTRRGKPGKLTLRAEAEGLKPCQVSLSTQK